MAILTVLQLRVADGLLLLLGQVGELVASVGLLPQSLRQGGGEGRGGVRPGRQCWRWWWWWGHGGLGGGGSSGSMESAMPAAPANRHHGREARTAGKAAGSCQPTFAIAGCPWRSRLAAAAYSSALWPAGGSEQ